MWVALLGFYAFVGHLVLSPQVTDAYRLYFMEGRLEAWAGHDGLDYAPGTRLALLQAPQYLSTEWGSPRRYGAWHIRGPAYVFFSLGEAPAGQRCFTAVVQSPPESARDKISLIWRLTGQPAATQQFVPAQAPAEIRWCYDGGLLKAGLNQLEIALPETSPRTILAFSTLVLVSDGLVRPAGAGPLEQILN